jgi:NAD(P)-dependent dehydrogenase (short-subunit alcohol dehydrogenase family)
LTYPQAANMMTSAEVIHCHFGNRNAPHGDDATMGLLQDKVAIVTGCGQGLGFDVARSFAEEGAKLVMVELKPDTLAEKAARLRATGTEVVAIVGDVSKRSTAQDAVAQAQSAFGGIDILVNNAQFLALPIPFIEQDDDHLVKMVHSGLFGTVYFMQAAYQALKQRRGSIINFGSGSGVIGNPGQACYAAAKEGIRGLTRVAAREWGPDGIRINVICPSARSPSLEAWYKDRPEEEARMLAGVAMGRFADGYEDLGKVAVFLARSDCFLTGQTLHVDGGVILP